MVTVVNLQIYTTIYGLMWVIFRKNCVNFIHFSIINGQVWMLLHTNNDFKSIQSLNNNLVIMTLLLTSLYKYNKIIYGSSIIIN